MSSVWLIAERQFRKDVFKRGFLFALISLPLFLGFTIGMGFLGAQLQREDTVLGYVDQARFLNTQPPLPEDLSLRLFESSEEAQAALRAGDIDAYYVLPDDYRKTARAELVLMESLPWEAQRFFADMVRLNLLAGQSPEVIERGLTGSQVTVHSLSRNRVFPEEVQAGAFAPALAALLIIGMFLSVSGTLAEAVAEEKENRTMEIVVTSVSPTEMMLGKILGILAMSMVLLAAWTLCVLLAVWLGGHVLGVEWLRTLSVNWGDIGLILLVAAPTLVVVSALMAMVGSMLTDSQEAQQIGPLLFLVLLLPFYFFFIIAQDPSGPFTVAATLFPPTSVMTVAIRTVFASVPVWQVVASFAIGIVCAAAMLWLAGRAFRIGMLRYGQRWRLGELFSRRPSHSPEARAPGQQLGRTS